MKNIVLQTTIEVFDHIEELDSEDQALLLEAHEYVKHAYAPYSKFQVGVAIRLQNQEIVGGSNLENAAYPMCTCAEPAALSAAASTHPNVPILAMAITVKNPDNPVTEPAAPCGACRQIISEMEDRYGKAITVILQGETGVIYRVKSIKDLLPLSFGGSFL